MTDLLKTPVGRLRLIGVAEGISFLTLLLIAMPVKYMMGIPELVKYTGWAHGLLFVLYIGAVIHAAFDKRWSLGRVFVALLASLIPCGPFILDNKLKKEEAEGPVSSVRIS